MDVKLTEVLGAPIDVAVHEQNTLIKITDGVHPSKVDNVLNKVNAVGPARAGERGRTVTTGRTFGH